MQIEQIDGRQETQQQLFPGLAVFPSPVEAGERSFLSKYRLEINKPKSSLTEWAAAEVMTDRDDRITRGKAEAAGQLQTLAGTMRFLSSLDPATEGRSASLMAKVAQRLEKVTEKLDDAWDSVRSFAAGGPNPIEKPAQQLAELPTQALGIQFRVGDKGIRVQVDQAQLSKSLWANSDQAKDFLNTAAKALDQLAQMTTQQSEAESQRQLYRGVVQTARARVSA